MFSRGGSQKRKRSENLRGDGSIMHFKFPLLYNKRMNTLSQRNNYDYKLASVQRSLWGMKGGCSSLLAWRSQGPREIVRISAEVMRRPKQEPWS